MSGVPFGGQFPGLAIIRNDAATPGERLDAGPGAPGIVVTGIVSGA
jgi:hypothetical protein